MRGLNQQFRPAAAVFWLVSIVLAGCLDGSDAEDGGGEPTLPPIPADWSLMGLPFGEGHDHADPAHHQNLSTPNFEPLGWEPFVSEYYGTTPAGNLCGDAQETRDGRRLAVIESRSDVGFTIVDVTDPRDPKWVGELVMRTTYIYDVAVVPDGEHVVAITADVTQPDRAPLPGGAVEDSGSGLAWRSPCASGLVPVRAFVSEDPVPRPASLLLISIEDPANPAIVDQRPLAGLGHSVFATEIEGRTWVLASVWGARTATSTFQFYEVADAPLGGKLLEHLATYTPAAEVPPQEADDSLGHNDGWIAKHPGTGQTVAWLAAWHAGLIILDLADPMRPAVIGRWTDYDPMSPAGTGAVHSAFPLPELRDGRHYTVIGPEYEEKPREDLPSGIVWVLDTTDPASIDAVAGWVLPHEVEWTGRLMFSTHYLSVVNDTVFVSMYHGGVWALDLSDVAPGNFTDLPAVGVFMPANVSSLPPAEPVRWAPTLEEVHAFADGSLVTFDSNSGVYTFRFDATRPAPAPAPIRLTDPDG